MIKTENIKVPYNTKTKKYYFDLGYELEDNFFNISIKDLQKGSNIIISAICHICSKEKEISYKNYNVIFERGGYFTCSRKCCVRKREATSLERYNINNYAKTEESKEKTKKTSLEIYGVEYHTLSKIVIDKRNITNRNFYIDKYSKLIGDNYLIIDKIKNEFQIKDIKNDDIFYIERGILYDRLRFNVDINTNINKVNDLISNSEKNIFEFIKEINEDILSSDRTILEGKELDIYIPTHNLAIEYNGLYWHSEKYKEKEYHLNKSLMCQEKGIFLMHIWEDEWVYKKDIIKSIISNRLCNIENKIYARKCIIKEVEDTKLVRKFLDENHIQGYTQSSIKLGLYYNDELVSLMTFGYRHTNRKKEFELIRFCNKLNTNVIGASSRLFKHLLNNYNYIEILSYSDFRLFDGKMYETLGFEKIYLSKPDYFWSKNLERHHRFNFNKQKLIKDGYDPNKTEVEIMYERGYSRIWSCGQVRWEFKKK